MKQPREDTPLIAFMRDLKVVLSKHRATLLVHNVVDCGLVSSDFKVKIDSEEHVVNANKAKLNANDAREFIKYND